MADEEKGKAVKFNYTVKLDDGTVVDSTADRKPYELTLGQGDFFPDVEKELSGMSPGDKRQIKLSEEQAFGPHHEQLVLNVEKASLPKDLEPELGMRLGADTPDGKTVTVVVTSIDGDKVTLDANHPMAGKALNLDVELVASE